MGAVLAPAFAIRLWNILAHTYVVFPDETFQYLEEAHRLAFGSGIVAWEYLDGIRSWLLPGLVAALMRFAALLDPRPQAYVLLVRLLCAAASLTVPYVGFRLALRRHGVTAALATGLLCAAWYELVYYSPVVLTEVLATHCALWAFLLGDEPGAGKAGTRRRVLAAGALLGLAACLRYQYAPALAAAALLQHGLRRERLLPLCFAGPAVVAAVGGVLDALTWGAPFQSVWLNFVRNAVQGVSAAMGTEPWHYPFSYFLAAWGPGFPVLIGLAALGAVEMPALALAATLTLALHAITPHKEVRFLYLAIAAAPVLIGLGLGRLLTRVLAGRRARPTAALAVPLLLAGGEALSAATGATPPNAWHRGRSAVQAFYAAHLDPGLCGLGVRTLWVYQSGGYTYLHRDVPIYFEGAEVAQRLEGSSFRLPLAVRLGGREVPQPSGGELAERGNLFNVLIGARGDGLPGFVRGACFGAGTADDPAYCLFRRPGACE